MRTSRLTLEEMLNAPVELDRNLVKIRKYKLEIKKLNARNEQLRYCINKNKDFFDKQKSIQDNIQDIKTETDLKLVYDEKYKMWLVKPNG